MNLSSHFPLTLISNRFLCHSLTQKHFFCTRLTVHWRDGYCNAFNVWLIYDGISRIVIYILRLCLYAAFCCCLIASIPEGGVNAPFALINVRDRLSRKVKKKKKGGPIANGLSGQVPWLVLLKCMNVHQKLHSDRSVKSKRCFQTNICYSRAGKYSL